jgi:hypothetical protein
MPVSVTARVAGLGNSVTQAAEANLFAQAYGNLRGWAAIDAVMIGGRASVPIVTAPPNRFARVNARLGSSPTLARLGRAIRLAYGETAGRHVGVSRISR